MTRRLATYLLCGLGVLAATVLAALGRLDISNLLLTVVVLVVATLTLEAAWLRPATLVIERQHELGHVGDLIFLSYPEGDVADGHVPREVLFQMYVAVANIGGRKALLLGLSLEAFLDSNLEPMVSRLLPAPVLAAEYRQWQSRALLAGSLNIQSETKMPPFVLEPDEVLSLRLRMLSGIDWSPSWDLARLKEASESLSTPVCHGRILLIYRRGPSLVRETVVLPLRVDAQSDFAQRLATITTNFTVRPAIEQRNIDRIGTDSGFPIAR